MTGTLELLCGPSGVGKTSSLPKGFVRSYRWTTRKPRDDKRHSKKDFNPETDRSELLGVNGDLYTLDDAIEKRDTEGVFESKFGGYFVTLKKFKEMDDSGRLIAVRRYPDPETGDWYGFPLKEMRSALDRGKNLSESIGHCRASIETAKTFRSLGYDVRSVLYLASLRHIYSRLLRRSFEGSIDDIFEQELLCARFDIDMRCKQRQQGLPKTSFFPKDSKIFLQNPKWEKEDRLRLESGIRELNEFVSNLSEFDEIEFIFPKIVRDEERNKILEDMLSELREGRIPEDLYDDLCGNIRGIMLSSASREEYIRRAISHFEEILYDKNTKYTSLAMTNFAFDYSDDYELRKVLILAELITVYRPEYVIDTISPMFGVVRLIRELGKQDMADRMFEDIELEFLKYMNGQDSDTLYGRAVKKLLANFDHIVQTQAPVKYWPRAPVSHWDVYSKMYSVISDINDYFLIEKAKKTELSSDEINTTMSFYLGLWQKFLDTIVPVRKLRGLGNSPSDEDSFTELVSDNLHIWTNIRESLKTGKSLFTLEDFAQIELGDVDTLRSVAEYEIINMLHHIDLCTSNILTCTAMCTTDGSSERATNPLLKGIYKLKKVVQPKVPRAIRKLMQPIVDYVLKTDISLPEHSLPNICLKKVSSCLREIKTICDANNENDPETEYRSFPKPASYRQFLRSYWISEVDSDTHSTVEEIRELYTQIF